MKVKAILWQRSARLFYGIFAFALWVAPQTAQAYTTSQTRTITSVGQQFTFNFTGLPRATGSVTVRVEIYGDYGSSSEYADVLSIDGVRPASNRIPGPSSPKDCNTTTTLNQTYKNFTVSSTAVNNNSALVVVVKNSAAVGTNCSRKQVVVRLTYASLPDLQVSFLGVTPTISPQGGRVTIRYRLRNAGGDSARSVKVRFYFSLDNTLNTSDVYLNVERTITVAGNSSWPSTTSTSSTFVSLPANAARGTRYVGAIVDYDRQIAESDENNNTRLAKVSVRAAITRDLEVRRLGVTPGAVRPGATVTVRYQLRNNGTAASGTFVTRLYFSTNSKISPSDTYLNVERSLSLAAGASSIMYYVTVRVPTNVRAGEYFIGALADYNSRVTESNEDNNYTSALITISKSTRADLQVTFLDVTPTTVNQGDRITIRYRLRNAGTVVAKNVKIRFYFSTDATITTSDTSLTNVGRTYALLAPGVFFPSDTKTAAIVVYLPANASTGTRYIGAFIDYDRKILESNEANNTRAAMFTVRAANTRDLEVRLLTVTPTTVVQGRTATVRYQLRNNGTVASGNFVMRLYFSNNRTIGSADTYLNVERSLSLAAGASSTIYSATIRIPIDAPIGARFIIAFIDYDKKITESNEDNNYTIAPITIISSVPLPDLQVAFLSVRPKTLNQGGRVTIRYRLHNAGNAIASHVKTRFYFSLNSRRLTSHLTNTERTSTLAPGAFFPSASDTISVVAYIPANAGTDIRYITAFIDYNKKITESNEDNNIRVEMFTVRAASTRDLEVRLLTVTPGAVRPRSTVTVRYQLRNNGTLASGTFATRLYFSTNSAISPSDTYLNVERSLSLAAGASSIVYSATVRVPTSVQTGEHFIGALADYNNRVTESNETNNYTAAPITISTSTRADLQVTFLDVTPTTMNRGGRITIHYRLRNAGTVAAKGVKTRFYLSTDATITTSDIHLTNVESTNSLEPGAFFPPLMGFSSAFVNIPANAPAGIRYIGAFIDYDGKITESNENNNTKAAAFTVVKPVEAHIEPRMEPVAEAGTEATPERGPEADCYTNGCPSGEVCKEGQCVADPCANKQCGSDEFCRNGSCVKACGCLRCKSDEACVDGVCVANLCASISCPSGEVCDATNGQCITNLCASVTCGKGRVCVAGQCEDDPCNNVSCASGMECRKGQCVDLNCTEASAEAIPDTTVVDTTTGGDKSRSRPDSVSPPTPGGCCDIHSENQHIPFQFFLLLGLVVIVGSRRR